MRHIQPTNTQSMPISYGGTNPRSQISLTTLGGILVLFSVFFKPIFIANQTSAPIHYRLVLCSFGQRWNRGRGRELGGNRNNSVLLDELVPFAVRSVRYWPLSRGRVTLHNKLQK